MKIIAINVGKVTEYKDLIASPAKVFKSAIDKSPVSSLDNSRPLRVSYLGLYGDEQADSRVHGGCDKALYAYPLEHYSFWEGLTEKEMRINVSFSFGHFGENLTVSGLTEHEVWVGETIWSRVIARRFQQRPWRPDAGATRPSRRRHRSRQT